MALKIPVACGGYKHIVIITDDLRLLLPHHDLEGEQIAVQLGAEPTECLKVLGCGLVNFIHAYAGMSYAEQILVASALLRDAIEETPRPYAHKGLPPDPPFDYGVYLDAVGVAERVAYGAATNAQLKAAVAQVQYAYQTTDYHGDPLVWVIFALQHHLLKPLSRGARVDFYDILVWTHDFFRERPVWVNEHTGLPKQPPPLSDLEVDQRQAKIMVEVLTEMRQEGERF